MTRKTSTSRFGVSGRESHDSSMFYMRKIYKTPEVQPQPIQTPDTSGDTNQTWLNRIYCHTSESIPAPSSTVALAFTSPPYNSGKDYDPDLTLEDYLALIERVGREVYRVLKPGGRYVINIANLGRKPYIPLHAHYYRIHEAVGFLPMGEIIWQKGTGASSNCAWGSWKSARAPRLRDLHEYLLVFAREQFSRPEPGESDIDRDEFLAATLSVWNIKPESARRIGHPAPFPIQLAERVIRLFSYRGDVVLDPFAGSGTTCVAAKACGRHFIGMDTCAEYCRIAEERLALIK